MSKLVENDPMIREVYQEFQRFTADPEMREQERRRQRYIIDYNLAMGASKKEGRAERDVEIARRMKTKGYDPVAIAEITGLSIDEIGRLN